VSQRTRDIGIRMALGADSARIATMIAREFAGIIVAGLVAGALAAILLSRVLSSMLFGVSATDAATFATVPLALALVSALAMYVPVRRATRVDPLSAIRTD
jgi:ABC-type antimicrobial peptide transport system permease subunit